jgi:hypothetical protein
VCGLDGIAVFDALHRRGTVTEALLFAFDLLELDGADYRPPPLGEREKRLAGLVDRRLAGIAMNDHTDAPVRAGPPDGLVEAALNAVPVRPFRALAEDQEPGQPAMRRHREGRW